MRTKSHPKSRTVSHDEEGSSSSSQLPAPISAKNGGKIRKNKNKRHAWRPWEKEAFINAFPKTFAKKWIGKGPLDLELCEDILRNFENPPGMTAEYVERFIGLVLTRVKRQNAVTDGCIDKWLEVVDALSSDHIDLERQLSLVMLVAKQEPSDDTPAPASFKPDLPQPDFNAIYEYFSCAFANKPLPQLTPIDSLVVEDCMQSLTYQIECLHDEDLRRSLRKVFLHMAQDPGDEPEQDHEDMRRNLVHNATVLNPLGLNAQAIVPVVPE